MTRADLDEFVECYKPGVRQKRKPTWSETNPEGRWRAFNYDEIVARDKVSLDLFWLRDESLEDSANLPGDTLMPGYIGAIKDGGRSYSAPVM